MCIRDRLTHCFNTRLIDREYTARVGFGGIDGRKLHQDKSEDVYKRQVFPSFVVVDDLRVEAFLSGRVPCPVGESTVLALSLIHI